MDFDGTLATYHSWVQNGTSLGTPIPLMVERVRRWLDAGIEVRIVTARAASNSRGRLRDKYLIQEWCLEHIGVALPVTAEKDFNMIALWDDRVVPVAPNSGKALCDAETDPLSGGGA